MKCALPLLTCERLRVGYVHPVTPPIDVTLGQGEFWVVVGRNGTGKTTWFRTLLGFLPAISGDVHTRAGLRASYVAQRTQFDPLFPVLARDVVAIGSARGRACLGFRFGERREVAAALERAGVSALADRPFGALSEGQKQRVLLARLWAAQPELALLDEPTSAMDVVAERDALAALEDLRKTTGCTIVVVTHEVGFAREFASHVLLFDSACENVLAGSPDEVLSHALFHRNYPEIPSGAD
jgi:zinc transport system ATP-binding protein